MKRRKYKNNYKNILFHLNKNSLHVGNVNFSLYNFQNNISHPTNLIKNTVGFLRYLIKFNPLLFIKMAQACSIITFANFSRKILIQSNAADTDFDYVLTLDSENAPDLNNIHVTTNTLDYIINNVIQSSLNVANVSEATNVNLENYAPIIPFCVTESTPDVGLKDYEETVGQLYFKNSAPSRNTTFESLLSDIVNLALTPKSSNSSLSVLDIVILGVAIPLLTMLAAYLICTACARLTGGAAAPAPVLDRENQPLLSDVSNPSPIIEKSETTINKTESGKEQTSGEENLYQGGMSLKV